MRNCGAPYCAGVLLGTAPVWSSILLHTGAKKLLKELD